MSNTISPQDLRIKNIVQHNGVYWYVTDIMSPEPRKDKRFSDKWVIGLVNGGMINVAINEIQPIPLTEEILVKAGFKKHKSGAGGQDMWAGMPAWSFNNNWLFRGQASNLHLVAYFNTQIQSLHQLQNLIFNIEGRELEIKL